MSKEDVGDSDSDDPDFIINVKNHPSDKNMQSEERSIGINYDVGISCPKFRKYENDSRRLKQKKFDTCKEISIRNTTSLNKKDEFTVKNDTTVVDIELPAKEEKIRADELWESFLLDSVTKTKQQIENTETVTSIDKSKISQNFKGIRNSEPIQTSCNEPVDDKKTLFKRDLTCKIGKKLKLEPCLIQESDKKQSIHNILNNVKKKRKMTTLETSKLDWNKFKEENDLKEDLSNFNRGKNGYLEKQDFLQRTDSRQFEIEKELRNIGKRKIQ